MYNS
ncbi:hypothetical protein D050_1958A, partial [Vibrio parahaemolyticus VPCR-2009]|jgi:hypothetical protein